MTPLRKPSGKRVFPLADTLRFLMFLMLKRTGSISNNSEKVNDNDDDNDNDNGNDIEINRK